MISRKTIRRDLREVENVREGSDLDWTLRKTERYLGEFGSERSAAREALVRYADRVMHGRRLDKGSFEERLKKYLDVKAHELYIEVEKFRREHRGYEDRPEANWIMAQADLALEAAKEYHRKHSQ